MSPHHQHEFAAALAGLGLLRGLSPEAFAARADAEFTRIDADRSGALDFDEFRNFYVEEEAKYIAAAERDGRASAKFREIAAGDAYIAKDKFWNVLQALGLFHDLTVAQAMDKVNEQFPLADIDGSGVLDEAEFVRYYSVMEGIQTSRRSSTLTSPTHGGSPGFSPQRASPFMGSPPKAHNSGGIRFGQQPGGMNMY